MQTLFVFVGGSKFVLNYEVLFEVGMVHYHNHESDHFVQIPFTKVVF